MPDPIVQLSVGAFASQNPNNSAITNSPTTVFLTQQLNGNDFELLSLDGTSDTPVGAQSVTITNKSALNGLTSPLIGTNPRSGTLNFVKSGASSSELWSFQPVGGTSLTRNTFSGSTEDPDLSGNVISFAIAPVDITLFTATSSSDLIDVYTSSSANNYAYNQTFGLSINGTSYNPIQLVFGKDASELFALCQLNTNAKVHAILLITNPSTTHVVSMYVDNLPEETFSISYNSFNNQIFISQNVGGTQIVTDKRGNEMVNPPGSSPNLGLVNNVYNTMLFDLSGNLFYPTRTFYMAKASKTLFPVCLTEGTRVLTPNGYIPVEQLKKYDYITTADGRNVTIKHVHHSQHFNVGEMEAPFLVPANAIGDNIPLHDVKLSPDHLVLVGDDCWLSPRHMAKRSDKVVQYSLGETIQYYAIMTANYFEDNLVIEDGVVVESYGYRRTVYDEAVKAFRRVAEEDVTTE